MATVLLVEDNDTLRKIYAEQLKRDGMTLLEAASVKEATDLLHKTQVDLMLLDILLPDKNGLVFLEELRKDHKFTQLPVILLTQLPDEATSGKSQNLNIHGYLVKDQITPVQISARVKLALEEFASQTSGNVS